MTMTGSEKRIAFQKRYESFMFLILRYQENFKKFVPENAAMDFINSFSKEEVEIMEWIEKNKNKYLKKMQSLEGN